MINMALSAEVKAAKTSGAPIVALESTIITHGMPYPQNLETAQNVEDMVRKNGAVPATIAVIDGVLHVGLEPQRLTALAQTSQVWKLSRADMAVAMAQGKTGATTVAATMIAARYAEIEVFATGGIGGVHRGAEHNFDISADLHELAQTSVCVVSAGAKAILDIPKTLEVLETLGVPVLCYKSDVFPAFWMSDSGHPAPVRVDNAAEIAKSYVMRRALGVPGGQLIANPIPNDSALPPNLLMPTIEAALCDAKAQNIASKSVTPFLLDKIVESTKGRSLSANIALVLNNACLAAQIACEIRSIRQSGP